MSYLFLSIQDYFKGIVQNISESILNGGRTERWRERKKGGKGCNRELRCVTYVYEFPMMNAIIVLQAYTNTSKCLLKKKSRFIVI